MCPPVVIPEHVVVGGPGGALDALVRAQVEVELGGVRDAHVHGGAGRDVAALAALLLLVRAEEARVVPLLHHDEGDPWFVVSLELGRKYLNRIEKKYLNDFWKIFGLYK